MVDKLLIIITSGAFPIPAEVTSSVETTLMKTTPYLAQEMQIIIIGRKQQGTARRVNRTGVSYVNFTAQNSRVYLVKIIKYVSHILKKTSKKVIIQLENCPLYVSPLKQATVDTKAQIWLSLHSTTFLTDSTPLKKRKIEKALSEADRIIVNSHFVKRFIQESFLVNQKSQEQIIVNHLGVDFHRFSLRRNEAAKKWREKRLKALGCQGKKIILYVGRLRESKGVHHLIEAIGLLKQRYSSFQLFIVGGHSYGKNKKTKYVRYLHQLATPHKQHIRFVSFVPHDKIHYWYLLADVFVCPSVSEEALGLVNLEAMAAALPIVASRVGGIPEVVKEGQNGFLVSTINQARQINEALYKLLSNEELSRSFGETGRRKVAAYYSWEQVASRLAAAYRKEVFSYDGG